LLHVAVTVALATAPFALPTEIVTVAFHPELPLPFRDDDEVIPVIHIEPGGGGGFPEVVADAVFEYVDDSPVFALTACTRYEYDVEA
jgi:hypothetical protein